MSSSILCCNEDPSFAAEDIMFIQLEKTYNRLFQLHHTSLLFLVSLIAMVTRYDVRPIEAPWWLLVTEAHSVEYFYVFVVVLVCLLWGAWFHPWLRKVSSRVKRMYYLYPFVLPVIP